jgi:hypothetical protein
MMAIVEAWKSWRMLRFVQNIDLAQYEKSKMAHKFFLL